MRKEINISVIIPAYNCEKTISKSINSILNQSFNAFEIIVVDDGSSDKTYDFVRISFPNVRLFKQENAGPASARNLGISVANGNWIAFLDSDDILNHDALRIYSQLIIDNPKFNWIAGAYYKVYNNNKRIISYNGKELKNNIIKNVFDAYDSFKYKIQNELITTCSVLINKNVFETVGKFNEQLFFGEDLDLWFRISLKYPQIGYTSYPIFNYIKTNSITPNYNYRKNELDRIKKSWSFANLIDEAKRKEASKILNIWIYRELKCIMRLNEYDKINLISVEYLNLKNRLILYFIKLLNLFK